MKEELQYIGEKIVKNHEVLARNVEKVIGANYSESLQNAGMPQDELIGYRANLIRCFGEALYGDITEIEKEVALWGKRAAEFAIRYDVSLSNSLRAISFYRIVIWDVFTEELERKQLAAITMLDVSKIIDPLMDRVCSVIGEVYEKHNKKMMDVAYTALEELSVPVVPISSTIAVIPIIGAIDTDRAQLIMETSLHEGARLNLQHIIFDVSGVPIVDTMVADQIIKIVNALELTGIKTILTGIRPEIAQTIVSLGVRFGSIKTRANMRQALQELGFRQIHKSR